MSLASRLAGSAAVGIKRAVIGVAVTAALGSASALARERGPVPQFTVLRLDGEPAAGTEIAGRARRVLLYVRPGSTHTRDVLRLIESNRDSLPGLLGLAVIVGAGVEESGRMREAFPGLLAASWYADPGDHAFAALRLAAAPALIGVRDGQIEWTVQGSPAGPRTVPSILKNWLHP